MYITSATHGWKFKISKILNFRTWTIKIVVCLVIAYQIWIIASLNGQMSLNNQNNDNEFIAPTHPQWMVMADI